MNETQVVNNPDWAAMNRIALRLLALSVSMKDEELRQVAAALGDRMDLALNRWETARPKPSPSPTAAFLREPQDGA